MPDSKLTSACELVQKREAAGAENTGRPKRSERFPQLILGDPQGAVKPCGVFERCIKEKAMKIIRFRTGGAGLYALPGEYPERELEELLGGEVEITPITRRLALAARRDGEEERLPALYASGLHGDSGSLRN